MIEESGEQTAVSTRGSREGLTEKVPLRKDIKETREPDMWLSRGRMFQPQA